MKAINCDCGKPLRRDDWARGECYGCFVGVGTPGPFIQWRGGGGKTREDFHARTNAEFLGENDGPGTSPT